jgi:probable rRNA maturation factor
LSIYFHNEACRFNYIGKDKTRKWLRDIIRNEKRKEGTINIVFTDNPTILRLNKTYLSHHYFTDVITFNYNEAGKIIGDIYISIDTVRENAGKYKTPFPEELKRVMVHGLLHLIGYNDKTKVQKVKISEKESFYL